jgi:molybdenum-dependent DNA-binding transcriptional regulator ModE
MHITLRQFEYFLALAETGQVSKAALRCNVSQSSVTIALRNLEQAVGTTLWASCTRRSRDLRTPDAGRHLCRQHRRRPRRTPLYGDTAAASASAVFGAMDLVGAHLVPVPVDA